MIPQNTISNNNEYGIFIGGSSSSVVIQNTYIGLSTNGLNEFGNQEGGIYVGSAVKSVQIGIREKSQSLPNKIVGNGGNGITLDGTDGALIEANKLDRNSGNGVLVANGTRNRIIANRANSNDLYGFKTIGRGRNTLRGNKGVNNKLGLYG
ncbi:MAG: right-handed parallel beta-helix repeat-containing protein [Cyanobacteria bacterium]|nr:right-handed parallel beta-helix repeat-containing protein [Cyanobacteriota bacterium]